MLEKIAAEMRAYAAEHQRFGTEPITAYQRVLRHGLMLTMWLDAHGFWRLSLARDGKGPSATEARVCRRDFEVPEHAMEVWAKVGEYHVCRLTWKELRQAELFEAGPAPEGEILPGDNG
jgi:hypothetical protein